LEGRVWTAFTFGYRAATQGVWAFYPIEQRFELLAGTLFEFIHGWYAGEICF